MTMILTILVIILINFENCTPASFSFDSDVINVEQALIYLNKIKEKTWIAGPNNFGKYLNLSQLEHGMGSLALEDNLNIANDPSIRTSNREPTTKNNRSTDDNDDIPDNYDAREMYPQCSTIPSIKDQSQCGCCWAISTASVFSDRLCIRSAGRINVNISFNHILSCAKSPVARGCRGGLESEAWKFLKKNGAVTGGDYGTRDGCQPFLIEPCNRPGRRRCEEIGEVKTPACQNNKCSNEWYAPEGELYKAKFFWKMPGNQSHPNNEIDIRREIYRNGPVTAAFKVYLPFYFYKSGIFQMDFTNWRVPEGGHSVRIVGWGVENKIPYWIIANSWGKDWGEGGFFRMLRGKNYCLIESFITAGIPDERINPRTRGKSYSIGHRVVTNNAISTVITIWWLYMLYCYLSKNNVW